MKKGIFVALSAVALFGLVLTGCEPTVTSSSTTTTSGGNQQTSSQTSSQGTTSTEPTPTVMGVADVLDWDLQNNCPTYDGDLVTFEEVTVLDKLEGSIYVQQVLGQTIGDLASIQIFCDNPDDFKNGNVVNATGTIGTDDGRIVLLDAEVTKVADGEEYMFYYFPDYTRSSHDSYATRFTSGVPVQGTFEVATAPTTIVGGESQTFYVVFPGEDTDTENPMNYFLMPVHIPANLTAREVQLLNITLSSIKAGDFINAVWCLHYSATEGVGFLLSSMTTQLMSKIDSSSITGIFDGENRGTDVVDYLPSFLLPEELAYMPSDLGHADVYSFYVDDSLYDASSNYSFNIIAYTYSTTQMSGTPTVFNHYVELFTAVPGLTGFAADASTYVFFNADSTFRVLIVEELADVLIQVSTSNPTLITGTNSGEVYAYYDQAVNSYVSDGTIDLGLADGETFTTALPIFDNMALDTVSYYNQTDLDRRNEQTYLNAEIPLLSETFNIWYMATGSDENEMRDIIYDAFDALEAMLYEEGFVAGTTVLLQTSTGQYGSAAFNADTNELVLLGTLNAMFNIGWFYIVLEVLVVDESLSSTVFTPAA